MKKRMTSDGCCLCAADAALRATNGRRCLRATAARHAAFFARAIIFLPDACHMFLPSRLCWQMPDASAFRAMMLADIFRLWRAFAAPLLLRLLIRY